MSDTLHDPNAPVELKDLFFVPESKPTTRKGIEACKRLVAIFQEAEHIYTPRTRQRKPKDLEILDQQLSAILGNLVAGAARKKPAAVAVSQSHAVLGKKDTHTVLNAKLPDVLQILHAAEVLIFTAGSYTDRRQATIAVGTKGEALMREFALSRKDFQHKDRQPLVLRAMKTAEDKRKNKRAKQVQLPVTEDVERMSAEVVRFNDFIATQDITYHGSREDIDDERKSVHRVFNNNRMDEGGRLYGGFWQTLSGAKEYQSDERTADITINNEHLVGLDYGQIAVRLLYSFEGQQVAREDAYILDDWGQESREGMKKLINSMINDPTGEPKAVKKLFGRNYGLTVPELTEMAKQSIYQQHAPIRNHFYGTSTFRIIYEESNHLMRLLMRLVDMNIPALPIHDCLYVKVSDQNTVRQLMYDMFTDYFKVNITIKTIH